MDNISRRRSNDEDGSCTATSMYLSFDAESTMSTECYKTLEAMTDISTMSALSIIEDTREDKHNNSTLENEQDSEVLSPLKTVKKLDMITTTNSPLRALPKNIMREYKAMCSTPSKEQLLKTVEIARGSDASRCMDLGVAFLGVEDEQQPAFFLHPLQQPSRSEDNKENTIPESVDGFSLSVSSSTIEKRMLNSVSTTGSLTGDESEAAISVIEKRLLTSCSTAGSVTGGEESTDEIKDDELPAREALIVGQCVEATPKAKECLIAASVEITNTVNISDMDTMDYTSKTNNVGLDKIDTINEDDETPHELTPKAVASMKPPKKVEASTKLNAKPKIAVLTSRNVRRSACEPNLQTNKPSRISMAGNKRQSLLPITQKKMTVSSIEAETEIPLLISKMLKITNAPDQDVDMVSENKKAPIMDAKNKESATMPAVTKALQPTEKRRSIMPPTKGRTSLMPSTAGEKRPFSFTHRMSVVVKTTLNSPARKVARRIAIATGGSLTPQQRRSMVATKSTQTLRMNKPDAGIRRSLLPNNRNTTSRLTTNALTSLKETKETHQTKLEHSLKKVSDEPKIKPQTTASSGIIRPKVDVPLACNICKEQFRAKYLLDTHKRIHESDTAVTPMMKKPTTSTTPAVKTGSSVSTNPNQCKYCDKKFALVRALHIHLLQNCTKIPPSEKRKLEYTEMNHVEKARLPSVFHHSNTASSLPANTAQATNKPSAANQKIIVPKIIVEAPKEKDSKRTASESTTSSVEGPSHSSANTNTAAVSSLQKPKKATAHSGVYRTPSKTVPCHICKLTFKSILDYTNHSLDMHGSKAQKQPGLNEDEMMH